jgi:hypothetical protein
MVPRKCSLGVISLQAPLRAVAGGVAGGSIITLVGRGVAAPPAEAYS